MSSQLTRGFLPPLEREYPSLSSYSHERDYLQQFEHNQHSASINIKEFLEEEQHQYQSQSQDNNTNSITTHNIDTINYLENHRSAMSRQVVSRDSFGLVLQSRRSSSQQSRFPQGFFAGTPVTSKRTTIRLNQNIYETHSRPIVQNNLERQQQQQVSIIKQPLGQFHQQSGSSSSSSSSDILFTFGDETIEGSQQNNCKYRSNNSNNNTGIGGKNNQNQRNNKMKIKKQKQQINIEEEQQLEQECNNNSMVDDKQQEQSKGIQQQNEMIINYIECNDKDDSDNTNHDKDGQSNDGIRKVKNIKNKKIKKDNNNNTNNSIFPEELITKTTTTTAINSSPYCNPPQNPSNLLPSPLVSPRIISNVQITSNRCSKSFHSNNIPLMDDSSLKCSKRIQLFFGDNDNTQQQLISKQVPGFIQPQQRNSCSAAAGYHQQHHNTNKQVQQPASSRQSAASSHSPSRPPRLLDISLNVNNTKANTNSNNNNNHNTITSTVNNNNNPKNQMEVQPQNNNNNNKREDRWQFFLSKSRNIRPMIAWNNRSHSKSNSNNNSSFKENTFIQSSRYSEYDQEEQQQQLLLSQHQQQQQQQQLQWQSRQQDYSTTGLNEEHQGLRMINLKQRCSYDLSMKKPRNSYERIVKQPTGVKSIQLPFTVTNSNTTTSNKENKKDNYQQLYLPSCMSTRSSQAQEANITGNFEILSGVVQTRQKQQQQQLELNVNNSNSSCNMNSQIRMDTPRSSSNSHSNKHSKDRSNSSNDSQQRKYLESYNINVNNARNNNNVSKSTRCSNNKMDYLSFRREHSYSSSNNHEGLSTGKSQCFNDQFLVKA